MALFQHYHLKISFLTLVKLHLARKNFELSILFQITAKEVSNVFITWVNFLYFTFKSINWWPSRDLVKFFSPTDFSSKFPSRRVIIDGTEMLKPKFPVLQQSTYSSYKNKITVKILVGITPGGLVSFVSDAYMYGGSTSDRQICECSPLSALCDPGDSIMADKGFNVQDLFM